MVHMRAKPVKLGLIMKSDTVPVVGHVLLSLVMVCMKCPAVN